MMHKFVRELYPFQKLPNPAVLMCALSVFKKASIGHKISADDRSRDSDTYSAGTKRDRKREHERRNLASVFTPESHWMGHVPSRRNRMRTFGNEDMVPTDSIPRSALRSRMATKNPTRHMAIAKTRVIPGLEGLSALTESMYPPFHFCVYLTLALPKSIQNLAN